MWRSSGMSDDIGPGDKVECVDITPRPNKSQWIPQLLRLGGKYIIREIVRSGKRKGVHLVGVQTPYDYGFYPHRFRLINRRGDHRNFFKTITAPIAGLRPDIDDVVKKIKVKKPEKEGV